MTGTDTLKTRQNDDFSLGVVEGFYGMPWSAEQRKILFSWMQKLGLNTYMYAPKDDFKHRAHWRDLYSVEEADILTNLIDSAQEKGVLFVYAISPGLDISFSSSKDVLALKRKLEQVSTFGCKAFALLFDDIDPELSEADRSVFASFGHAQVSVVNEVYEHLGQPKFLFCPTEYCLSRAVPSIQLSGYLSTLGTKLMPGIDIMWTGCKVISRKISVDLLEDISTVLRRAPVIWDNIHANDYDPRRIFLGPYDGRSPDIIPYIRGVMTNPNCEFEANYIACHTLGQWCKSNQSGVKKGVVSSERLSPIAADIKLETESDAGSDDDLSCGLRYKPRQALKIAINDWHPEFLILRHPHRRLPLPLLSSIGSFGLPTHLLNIASQPSMLSEVPTGVPVADMMKTCTVSTPTIITPAISGQVPSCLSGISFSSSMSPLMGMTECCTNATVMTHGSLLQPLPHPVNALAVGCLSTDLDGLSDSGTEVEAMDCIPPAASGSASAGSVMQKNGSSESLMQVEACDGSDKSEPTSVGQCLSGDSAKVDGGSVENVPVTLEDINLLTDLFYLPFEHGVKAVRLLNLLHWLIDNVYAVQPDKKESKEYMEWQNQAAEFEKSVQETDTLLRRLFYSPNKALLCCIHTYLWDLKSTLSVCLAFIKWMEHGLISDMPAPFSHKMATWFSEGYKEAFTSGDNEPWAFRGGLQSELQRFLPVAPAHDLFFIKPPELIVPILPHFRPYRPEDEDSVYDICLKTCDDGMDGTDVFPENPKLIGDRLVGRFLTLSPEFCFVAEDPQGVCGYVLAARDAVQFKEKTCTVWTPTMCEKYPKPLQDGLSPAQEVMLSFHGNLTEPCKEVYGLYPSILRLDIMPSRLTDPAVPRRLLACSLCALSAAGSNGAFTELNTGDEFMADVYAKLGFIMLQSSSEKPSEEMIYMGRMF